MIKKPIVAHIIRGFLHPTETFVANQINTLKNYQPVVFCHHQMPNDMNVFCRKYSVRESLPYLARFWDNINYRLARRLPDLSAKLLSELAEKNNVRLLHFHYLVDARFFIKLKQMTRLPAVVSVYGYDVSIFPNCFMGFGKHYLKPLFEKMDFFIVMSEDMQKDLIRIGCPQEKIKVHYHGINTVRFKYKNRKYAEKNGLNILMCGTLEPKKAQDQVIAALRLWEKSKTSEHSFQITFMGDGHLRAKLESLIESFGWRDRVNFLGHVPHNSSRLVEEYMKADIFTLPSVTIKGDKEGIPGTLVEAMANGLPVVSTYHAGIPDLITDGHDGLLVEENDAKALSDALGRLIEDRDMREKLGTAAAITASIKCIFQNKTADLEKIYDELLL